MASMGMARKLAALKALTDDELIAEHDELVGNTGVGTRYYLDELRYREQSRVASSVERFTKWIWRLTFVVTLATVINLAVVILLVVVGK